MWLLPVAAFFSIAGFFHHYYLIMLAAPIAALSGAGWTALVRLYQEESGWKKRLLPIGILLTTAFGQSILKKRFLEMPFFTWTFPRQPLFLLNLSFQQNLKALSNEFYVNQFHMSTG